MKKAKCFGIDPDYFYPVVNGGRRINGKGSLDDVQSERTKFCHGLEGKTVGTPCPVRMECLNYAINNFQDYGVWGGTTEKERVRIRRSRNKRIAS